MRDLNDEERLASTCTEFELDETAHAAGGNEKAREETSVRKVKRIPFSPRRLFVMNVRARDPCLKYFRITQLTPSPLPPGFADPVSETLMKIDARRDTNSLFTPQKTENVFFFKLRNKVGLLR